MSCYRFEDIQYENPLFEIVDKTYVIHLEGNGRLESVKSELYKYKPSRQCTIVFNKGYKKCHKPELHKQLPPYDLVHAYFTILKDAKKNNYKHILILEDDFFFDESVIECASEVETFLLQNKDTPISYFIGCIPFLVYPSLTNHYKTIQRGAAHSVIYNDLFIEKVLKENIQHVDWDLYMNKLNCGYMYYKPLCYQYIPETDNSKSWGDNSYLDKFISKIVFKTYQLLGMDRSVTPGYPLIYIFSKLLFWIIAIIVAVSIFYVTKQIKQIKQIKLGKLFNLK